MRPANSACVVTGLCPVQGGSKTRHHTIASYRILLNIKVTMHKRNLLISVALTCVVPAYAQSVSPKALEIHDSAIVIDTHADTPQRFLDENYDIGSTDPKDRGHISEEHTSELQSLRHLVCRLLLEK